MQLHVVRKLWIHPIDRFEVVWRNSRTLLVFTALCLAYDYDYVQDYVWQTMLAYLDMYSLP